MKKLILFFFSAVLVFAFTQCYAPDLNISSNVTGSSTLPLIKSFKFRKDLNDALKVTVYGIIKDESIVLTVPAVLDLSDMKASFEFNPGNTVTVEGFPQISGTTPNDFSTNITYEVFSKNGIKKTYTVTVHYDNGLYIKSIELDWPPGVNDPKKINGVISANTINFTVPYYSDFATDTTNEQILRMLENKDNFVSNEDTFPLSVAKIDESDPLKWKYSIQISNATNTSETYTCIITMLADSQKDIINFGLKQANNDFIEKDTWGIITGNDKSGHYIHIGVTTATQQKNTPEKLIPTFATSGIDTKVTYSEQEITSGVTEIAFSTTLVFTVIAQDGTQKDYTIAFYPEPAFTSFYWNGDTPDDESDDIFGIISSTPDNTDYNYNIKMTFPAGAMPDTFKPIFTVYPVDATITCDGVNLVSDETEISTSMAKGIELKSGNSTTYSLTFE